MPPDVGVVLINYRTARLIEAQLEKWSAESLRESRVAEVVVVDNDPSEPGSWDQPYVQPVTRIDGGGNRGYAPGVNRGWHAMRHGYVLLLNPDAEITLDAIDRLAQVLDDDPRIGAVSPLHLDHEGRPTNPYRRIPEGLDILAHRTYLYRFDWAKRRVDRYLYRDLGIPDASMPRFAVEQPPASCLMLRRTVSDGDLMDERFPILFNDVDLSRSLRSRGWLTVVEPQVDCRHEPATSTKYLGLRAAAEYYVGAYRYVKKWEGGARAEQFRAVLISSLIAVGSAEERAENRRALLPLLRNQSVFDSPTLPDPVRQYWPSEVT